MRREMGSRSCAQSRTAETRRRRRPAIGSRQLQDGYPGKVEAPDAESDDDEDEVDDEDGPSCVNASSSSFRLMPVRVLQEQVGRPYRDTFTVPSDADTTSGE